EEAARRQAVITARYLPGALLLGGGLDGDGLGGARRIGGLALAAHGLGSWSSRSIHPAALPSWRESLPAIRPKYACSGPKLETSLSRPTAPRKPSRWRRSAAAARISVRVALSVQGGHSAGVSRTREYNISPSPWRASWKPGGVTYMRKVCLKAGSFSQE